MFRCCPTTTFFIALRAVDHSPLQRSPSRRLHWQLCKFSLLLFVHGCVRFQATHDGFRTRWLLSMRPSHSLGVSPRSPLTHRGFFTRLTHWGLPTSMALPHRPCSTLVPHWPPIWSAGPQRRWVSSAIPFPFSLVFLVCLLHQQHE